MIIDVAKCEDCNNCLLSCKDEHVENDWPGYTAPQPRHGHKWMNVARRERGQFPLIDVAYRPTPCMQCEKPACAAASDGSVRIRKDGLVMIDPQMAKGHHHLVEACPYGAIWWNEESQVPQKCTFCAHLLDKGWKQPRCVQACPTGALRSLLAEPGEMARIATSEKLSVLHPEFDTSPRVYYANLYRFDSCFIAGSVACDMERSVDCVPGARVMLNCNGAPVAETHSDAFGDFRFDGLQTGKDVSTIYTIQIEVAGFDPRNLTVSQLTSSLNIGTICLAPSREFAGSTSQRS